MSIHNGEVEIYEFSRGFTEVEKNGKWISGGFGDAINRSNYHDEIPTPIQNFINNNQNILGIPTGYILHSELALIARVIDNRYCVLAVANYQKDNRATEGIVGYRYFWLDKESEVNRRLSSMDGVGTLLHWWLDDKLSFDMNPDSFTGNKLVCHQYLLSNSNQSDNQQNYPVYPSILGLANSHEDDRIQLHNQAVQKAEELGLPIAWAWNVHKLDFPEFYIAIWCADEPAKQKIESDLKRKNVAIYLLPPRSVDGVLIKPRPVPDNLEKILDEFVQLDNNEFISQKRSEKARAIIEILCNGENIDWSRFFTQENQHIKHLNQDPQSESVRYYALLPILDPAKIIEWLNWLRASRNQNYIEISFETQTFIYKACNNNEQEVEILRRIIDGISFLFNELVDGSSTDIYENSRFLLIIHKNNIWAGNITGDINNYVSKLVDFMVRKAYNVETTEILGGQTTQDFFDNLNDNIFHDQQHSANSSWVKLFGWGVNKNHAGFSDLAKLLHQLVNTKLNAVIYFLNIYEKSLLDVNLLAAICYQNSEGSIPFSVFWKVDSDRKKKINIILRFPPQERGASLRKWLNRIIVGGLTLGILFLLVQGFPKFLTSISQRWQSSSQPSLKESFEECRYPQTPIPKSLKQNKQIQKCNESQLKKILQSEINKLSQLNQPNIPDEEKTKLREGETYKYIQKSFYVSMALKISSTENDKYVLKILKYLKQSLDGQTSYDEIIQPLERCAKKSEVEQFKTCISKIER